MRRTLTVLLILCSAASAIGQRPPQLPGESPIFGRDQQPATPTFQTAVDFVRIDVRVKDAQGRFVRDLTKDDFIVLDEGRQQPIATFALVDAPQRTAPVRSAAVRRVAADVSSNSSSRDGRLYVLMLDDLHVHEQRAVTMRELATEFIERHVTEDDRVAIATTSGASKASQEFTNDSTRLLHAISEVRAHELPGPGDALSRDAPTPPGVSGLPAPAGGWNEKRALESMRSVLEWLSNIPERRKAMVLISEGLPLDLSTDFLNSGTGDILALTRDVIAAAAQANVGIYAIDPRGLPTAPASTVKPLPVLLDEDLVSLPITLARQSLVTLSEETGGAALIHSNDFAAAFDRVVDDSSVYYLLGFSPTGVGRRAKFHHVDVRMKRPGLSVQSRRGYADRARTSKRTATPGLSKALGEAFQSPVPVAGLALDAMAAPFRGAGSKASVAIVIEAHAPDTLPRTDGVAAGRTVDVFVAAASGDGKVRDSERGSLQFRPRASGGEHGGDRSGDLRLVTMLELSPGRYHLRVAASQPDANLRGSVLHDFDVVDLTKGPIAMSGLLLSSTTASRTPTAGPFTRWRQTLQSPPTTSRTFSAADELRVFGEIYCAGKDAPKQLKITTSIHDEDGAQRIASEDVTSTTMNKAAFEPLAHTATVSLKDLRPGRYVLSVEVREVGGSRTAAQRVPFTIAPQRP